MKVLWITNTVPKDFSIFYGFNSTVYGGWLEYSGELLKESPDIELSYAFPWEKTSMMNKFNDSYYYPFKLKKKYIDEIHKTDSIVLDILDDYKPDIVHINGTEFRHSLIFAKYCEYFGIPFVVSIQGIISEYSKHFYSGLISKEFKIPTLKDFLKGTSIDNQRKNFQKRGLLEKRLFGLANNFIGRTQWDFATLTVHGNNFNYYHLNELLREDFYNSPKWDFKKCEKNSIFISQASYPIKGFHVFLDALHLIKMHKNNLKVYVAGHNHYEQKKYRQSGYQKFISNKIKNLKLSKHIIFLGELNSKQMISMFLKSNVFVSASSIENSPNSVSEALYLNVPTVASYVGGVPSLVEKSSAELYQFDSATMLAYKILEILDKKIHQKNTDFHQNFDPKSYISNLINIYSQILRG